MDRFTEESAADLAGNFRRFSDDLGDYRADTYELCPRPTQVHCVHCGVIKLKVEFEGTWQTSKHKPVCCEGPVGHKRAA
jgi:hypothetical protein